MNENTTELYNEHGQVNDPKVAEDLAYLAKPAEDRELELKRQAEIGLTAEQERNIKVMDTVAEKYPNAVKPIETKAGRLLFIREKTGVNLGDIENLVAISKYGVMRFSVHPNSGDNVEDLINFEAIAESSKKIDTLGFNGDTLLASEFFKPGMVRGEKTIYELYKTDLNNKDKRSGLRETLEKSEVNNIKQKEIDKVKEATPIDQILADL